MSSEGPRTVSRLAYRPLTLLSVFALVVGLAQPATATTAPASTQPATLSPLTVTAGPAIATAAAGPATAAPAVMTQATANQPASTPEAGGGASTAPEGERLDVYSGLPGTDDSGAADEATGAGAAGPVSGVDPAVQSALDEDGTAPVIIRLREQADLAQVSRDALRAGQAAAAAVLKQPPDDRSAAEQAWVAREAGRTARAEVVVDTLQAVAGQTQPAVRELLADHAAGDVRDFWIFNGLAATVDDATLEALADHPDVASVTLDETIILDDPVDPGEPLLPSDTLEAINAPDVWGEYGTRGAGVVVGIMDTGADADHPALAASFRGRDGDLAASWLVTTGENYPEPGDGAGHGTHVTGSIVGAPPGEVTGVAPDAEWIAAKVLNDSGVGAASWIHEGFEWMLAPGGDPAAAPHVVNNSWGNNLSNSDEFWDDVAAWVTAGIVPVFANGNAGPGTGTVGSPASFPHSIGVGATDNQGRVAFFSSRGPVVWDGVEYTKPDISAPGYQVRSTVPFELDADGDGYATASGTSMATPHVTGAVALMLSAAPDLTVDAVRDALAETASGGTQVAALPNAYGAGIVDAYAAVTHVAHSGGVTGTVTDPAGEPVEATVTVGDHRTSTDPQTGGYALRLPAGTYPLTVSAYGLVPHHAEVTLTVGGTVTVDATLAIAPEQTLAGTVAGPAGPVPDARVSLADTPLAPVRTDAAGRFALTIAEGSYDLVASAGGFAPATVPVEVDGATDVTIDLTPAAADPGWSQYQNNPARTGRGADSLAGHTLRPDWSVDAGGDAFFASPVIADGTVFLNLDEGELAAFNLADGQRRWTFPASEGMRGTPAVADGVVYTGGGVDGGIHALDADTGELIWRLDTPGRRTIYTSPVVAGGVVYVTTGFTPDTSDTVYALDAATGAEIWSVDVGAEVFAGPAVAGGVVAVASADERRLYGLDAATGDQLWSLHPDGLDEFIGGPSIADGTVYIITSVPSGGLAPGFQGSLLAVDAGTGTLRWETPAHGDGQGTVPAVYGDLVIAGSHGLGTVGAYDRHTGEPVWHYGLEVSGGVSASVLVSGDGYVVAGAQIDERVFVLDATDGTLVWEQPVSDAVLSSAAYAEGRLVIADNGGNLHAFHPTGQLRGVVSGPDGPLPATVRVVEAGQEVTADPDTGGYEIAGLPPGEYTVEVRHYGHAMQTRSVRVLVAQAVTLDVELAAVGNGSLSGVVTDQDGAPVPGATVALSPSPLQAAVTGDDGGYAFAGVAAGSYRIEVAAAGYETFEDTVTVTEGGAAVVDATLERFDIAVVSDFDARVTNALAEAGWRVEQVTFAEIDGTVDRYRAVVLSGMTGDRADADLERFARIVAQADEAGVSLVFLGIAGPSHGSIRTLSRVAGDPASEGANLANRGVVWLEDVVDHPITASLPDTGRVPLLASGSWHSWFSDYSGYTLGVLGNDRDGRLGDGIGYQPRTVDSNHILLSTLAPASWSTWEPAARDLLLSAVDHAANASYGRIQGRVTGADGEPRAATVEVVGSFAHTAAGEDGGYDLLLEPGDYTLRFRSLGAQSVDVPVTVAAGQVQVRDVTLPPATLGTVTGEVTDASRGTPVGGATVALAGSGLPPATTGEDGTYLLEDVPGGSYQVEFTAEGYDPLAVDAVEVVNGAVTTLDAALTRAPGVVVVGDNNDDITEFLEGHSVPVEQAGWEVVDALDDVEVVILNNPPSISEEQFLAALAAFDEAGVSVIFPADGWSFRTRGLDMLVEYTGNPPDYGRLGGFNGPDIFLHHLADHPIFAGIEDPVRILAAGSEAGFFPEYTGITLAEVAEDGQEPAGIGVAYDVRTPDSVHLLLSGLAATFRNTPTGSWTQEGQQIFLNAVRWAAEPQQSGLAGLVTDPAGEPVPDAVVEVVGTHWRAVTGDDGTFTLGVPPGEHTVRYQGFGYVPVERTVTLAAGVTADGSQQLEVGDVGSITGVVTSTEDAAPLPDTRVDLLGSPYETVTGADGSYTFTRVEPGDYELEVEAAGHVRTLVPVTVATGQSTRADVALRVSPRVGIIDDSDFSNSRDRGKEFLADWGYLAEDIGFDSLDRLRDLDLVVANISEFDFELSFEQFKAFEDAVNRFGVPVLWLDQHTRGSIDFLHEHDGNPAVVGEGIGDGDVTATVVADHPLVAGLPDQFNMIDFNSRYSWFDEFDGHTVATLATTDRGEAGATIAYRGRTAGTVDVLLSTLTITTLGAPSTRQSPAVNWTPESERVLVNALEWALDAQGLAAEVRGTVTSQRDGRVPSQVEVLESGRVYAGRSGDGTFLVPLQPGTWTLEVSSFGHAPETVQVTVQAGDVETAPVTLTALPAGTVAGTVTGPDGTPVAGAQVTLLDTPLSATTGADGSFTIGRVPEGTWTVRVTADGFRATQLPVSVTAGQATPVAVALKASADVAVVDTSTSSTFGKSLAAMLSAEGYEVELVARSALASLVGSVGDYDLVIFNSTLLSSNQEAFGQAVDAAAAAGVSTIFGSQFGSSYPIPQLSAVRGDPEQAQWGFVSVGVDYVPSVAHPIFAGYPVGEPIELITSNLSNLNQQWGSYSGWSGQSIAHVHGRTDGADLGEAVGYRFTSATSVEVLLGSLSSSSNGSPDERWTADARQIYLNAVAWAIDTTQAQVAGTVTGAGQPLAGATVTAVEAGTTAVTAADGSYALGLAAGTYTMRVEAPGYATAEETVDVPASGTVTLDVDLVPLPRGEVSGTVTSTTGAPVAGATLSGTGPLDWQATTGADGGYTAGDLLEGDYQVTVTADGFLPATAGVTVVADQVVTLDVTLQPTVVGVLGDVDGALTAYLREQGVPAAELEWDAGLDLDGYEAVVVNGGDPDAATFDAVLAAADAAEASLIFTGTWAVDRGGIRLLERHTGRVEVGVQGYGDGPVQLTGFDPDHRLFTGLDGDPATLIVAGGYYSVIESYRGVFGGWAEADLLVERDSAGPVSGTAAAWDWRTAGSVEILLSASAVTEAVGPGLGWTADGGQLLVNAVDWARDAQLEPPPAPSIAAEVPVTVAGTVTVTGTSQWPWPVTVYRNGSPVAIASTAEDGSYSAEVPLEVGDNILTAVAANLAGESPESAPVTVSRWVPTWEIDGHAPAWFVRLALDGIPPLLPPAQEATLVVRDADGEQVRREPLQWGVVFYLATVTQLPAGDYQLSAELVVDGHLLVIEGPPLK